MTEKKVVKFPTPIAEVPGTEAGIMQLYSAIGIFDQVPDIEPHYRTIYFSSARIPETDPAYAEANGFGITLGENDIDGGTGGGPSLMTAFNAGILEGKRRKGNHARSYGCSIDLYPNQKRNAFLEKEYVHRHFATRLHQFGRLGRRRSFVAAPLAGIGTLLEVAWICQLLQAEQLDGALFVLVGDMWPPLLGWMRTYMLNRKTINESDLDLVKPVTTYAEAVPLILEHKARFMRKLAAG